MNTPRNFTANNIEGTRIWAKPSELIERPLPWQVQGLQQTASGYGAKLTTSKMIRFEGRDRRLYATVYGNAGSVWFMFHGHRIHVNA
jgi:hypothetical protein